MVLKKFSFLRKDLLLFVLEAGVARRKIISICDKKRRIKKHGGRTRLPLSFLVFIFSFFSPPPPPAPPFLLSFW